MSNINNNEDNNENLFAVAARKKYRFNTSKGQLSVEDLFDLKLADLDDIAVVMDEALQKKKKGSFVSGTRKTQGTVDEENKFKIVLHVIEYKLAEDEKRKQKNAKEAQKTFLKSLLEKKQLEQLESLSIDEVQKQLDSIGD